MIILASKSPRRGELLAQIGVNFICKVSNVDETPQPNEPAKDLVLRLATAKAQAVYKQLDEDALVLGADTVISIDGDVLGKPKDKQDALIMLRRLSGRSHRVITAVALLYANKIKSVVVESDVTFTHLSEEDLNAYSQTEEPYDKAGAYAIQGMAAQYISHLSGSYSAVMGLPLYETATLLKQAGINLLDKKG